MSRAFQVRKQKQKNNRLIKTIDLGLQRSGVPNTLKVKLAYVSTFNFAASGVNKQVYRMNGPFDPDYSGVGSQPVGYDEWSQFYGRYYVDNCEIQIEAINNSGIPVTICLFPNQTVSSLSSVEAYCAQYGAKWLKLAGNGAQNRGKLQMTTNTKDWEGWPGFVEDLTSAVNTTPVQASYYSIAAENYGGTTLDIYVTARIIYSIKFFTPKVLAFSTLGFKLTDEGRVYNQKQEVLEITEDKESESSNLVTEDCACKKCLLQKLS